MKKIFIVTLLCAIANSLQAQTNTFPQDGNVGIGTTSPQSKVTITAGGTGMSFQPGGNPYFGTLGFNRESATGSIFDSSNPAFQLNNGPDGNFHFQVYNGGGTIITNNAISISGSTGNVGIGTATPSNLLTVNTTLDPNISSGLLINNSNLQYGNSISFATGGTVKGVVRADQNGNLGLDSKGGGNIDFNYYGGNGDVTFWRGNGTGTGAGVPNVVIKNNGYFGLGTNQPGAALSISNSTPIIRLFDADFNPADGSSMGKIEFGSSQSWASIETFRNGTSLDDVTSMVFRTSFATGAGGDGPNIERMRINPNGFVGIGTSSPDARLAVNGTIHTKEVKVDLTGWSDYVFDHDYKLKPLSEVKTYIDQNHHLPEMPSAAEVEKDGLNLGEMNKLLTKKVEELTLYLIEKGQQIETLKLQQNEFITQKAVIISTEERIAKLEQQLKKLLENRKD